MTDQELIAEYNSGTGSTKLAKKLGVAQSTISRRLKKLGVKPRAFKGSAGTNSKYFIKSDAFACITTEAQAYWLGFLFADGCVVNYQSRGTSQFKLDFTLKRDDELTVLLFKEFLQYSGNIYRGNTTKGNPYSKLVISNRNLCLDLINLGCVPRKTFKLKYPNLPASLNRHFIRGYFDGDGCIAKSHDKVTYVSILSTKEFLTSVQSILAEEAGISKKDVHKTGNIYRLLYHRKADINKLKSYFYHEANLYMLRKQKRFIEHEAAELMGLFEQAKAMEEAENVD